MMDADGEQQWLVGALMREVEPIAPDATCSAVLERMSRPSAPAVAAVVSDGRPIGLIDRARYLSAMAQPFSVELFARRPVAALMDRPFQAVEADTPVDVLDSTYGVGDALPVGFAVTRGGRYAGVGFTIDLARRMSARLQHQNANLLRARQELSRANEAKSDFLANVSHELRTPLNAIIGFSEAMAAELFGPIEQPRYREYLSDIRTSAGHLLSLINDLIDIRQAEADKLTLVEEPIDLDQAGEAAMRVLAAAAREGGVAMRRRADANLPRLRADQKRVRQILLNLLSNAIKFTPAGGAVTLDARLRPDGGLRLVVRDDGVGIAAHELPRVLSPFGRAESTYVRSKEGTGLGLPLTKRIVERHGGVMRIASELGRGTEVTVDFPAERTLGRAEAERPQARMAAAG